MTASLPGTLSGLSGIELQTIFDVDVKAEMLLPATGKMELDEVLERAKKRTSRQPKVTFVAGQPAAYKSAMEPLILSSSGLVEPAVIDADRWRVFHRSYKQWMANDPLNAGKNSHDAVSWWVEQAIEFVATNRLDALVSATLKSPEKAQEKLRPFQEQGYKILVIFMAVHPVSTGLGIVKRYLNDAASGAGRYVPPPVHDAACAGVLDTAGYLDQLNSGSGDITVAVYRPDVCLPPKYSNRWVDGSWQLSPAGARSSIEECRVDHWNDQVETFRDDASSVFNSVGLDEALRSQAACAIANLVTGLPSACLEIPNGHG